VLNDEVPRGDSPNGIDPRTQITFANPLFQPADEEVLPSEDSQDEIASGTATAKEPYGAKKGVKAKLASDVK